MTESDRQSVEVRLVWADPSDLPVYAVNQFATQSTEPTGREEFLLTAGYLAPPLMVGDEKALREGYLKLESIEVKPFVRLAMNRARMRELADLLQRVLDRSEKWGGETDAGNSESV